MFPTQFPTLITYCTLIRSNYYAVLPSNCLRIRGAQTSKGNLCNPRTYTEDGELASATAANREIKPFKSCDWFDLSGRRAQDAASLKPGYAKEIQLAWRRRISPGPLRRCFIPPGSAKGRRRTRNCIDAQPIRAMKALWLAGLASAVLNELSPHAHTRQDASLRLARKAFVLQTPCCRFKPTSTCEFNLFTR